MRSFSIEVSGHRFQGAWCPIGADRIEVRSAYGKQGVRLSGRDPGAVARDVLSTMVPHPKGGERRGKRRGPSR